MKGSKLYGSHAILILLPILLAFGVSSGLRVIAKASYTISISVSPSSGDVGDSFTVTASVSISGLDSGTAYVVMKTIAPDGSYSYYASSAQNAPPYRQWVPDDMPVSMTYSWTVTADKEGIYTSVIEITIDGDVAGGFLKDSRSATFEASSPTSPPSGSIDVSVSPISVQKGESVTISVKTDGYLPPNPSVYTYVYPPSSSDPIRTYAGTGTFTFTVPSDGPAGTWRISGVIKDQSNNIFASDTETFTVIDSTSSSSSHQTTSLPSIWVTATPNPADLGETVLIEVHYRYDWNEYCLPNPIQIKIGSSDWVNSAGKFEFTPTFSGTISIGVRGYFDRRDLPGSDFGTWVSNSTTLLVRKAVKLLLDYPKKVHVGDLINITAKLMCGDGLLKDRQIRVFVDEGEFHVKSGQSITILAERPGTIDISALFEGDQEYSPAQNGGGLIEVWTKPVLKVTIGAAG